MKDGIFVAVEGLDGSGKTTVAASLVKRMCEEGITTTLTAEPTCGPIGILIRTLLSAPPSERPEAATMALIFAADRREHGVEIQRILDTGTNVVCDRYILTSLVYQVADGLLESDVNSMNGFNFMYKDYEGYSLQKDSDLPPLPTLHIVLDLPVEKALERLEKRGRAFDRFETVEFLTEVRRRYLCFCNGGQKALSGVFAVNADRPVEEIVEDCWNLVKAAIRE